MLFYNELFEIFWLMYVLSAFLQIDHNNEVETVELKQCSAQFLLKLQARSKIPKVCTATVLSNLIKLIFITCSYDRYLYSLQLYVEVSRINVECTIDLNVLSVAIPLSVSKTTLLFALCRNPMAYVAYKRVQGPKL